MTAVNWAAEGAYRLYVCEGEFPPKNCPNSCWLAPYASKRQAFCRDGMCQVVDVTKDIVSACKTVDDCVLRSIGCHEACDGAGEVIGLNKAGVAEFVAQKCNPLDQPVGCPTPPTYSNYDLSCVGGYCLASKK